MLLALTTRQAAPGVVSFVIYSTELTTTTAVTHDERRPMR